MAREKEEEIIVKNLMAWLKKSLNLTKRYELTTFVPTEMLFESLKN
ncbi:MAG: hypothetical protein ACRD38_05810 [Nitrososphaerales archaeon]